MTAEVEDVSSGLAGFDTETTGLDEHKDRIVSAALVRQDRHGVEKQREDWLINPGILIPREAQKIHGITNEVVIRDGAEAPSSIERIVRSLEKRLRAGDALVVQNAPYDLTLLEFEARRYGISPLSVRLPIAPVLDPVMLARVAKLEGRRSLAALCERFGVRNPKAHSAYADASTTLTVVRKMMELEIFRGASFKELHAMQHELAIERAEAYQADLRGPDGQRNAGTYNALVTPSWPLKGVVRLDSVCRDCEVTLTDEDLESVCGECLRSFSSSRA